MHFRGSRRIKIKNKKGKSSKKVHENALFKEKMSFKKILFPRFFPTFSLMVDVQEDLRNKKSIESCLNMINDLFDVPKKYYIDVRSQMD